MTQASYHAIYVVLGDEEFLPASIRSVYDHITGATIITSHDRDRWDREVEPSPIVESLLARDLDPERKINVISSVEVSESLLRNRAMAYASGPRAGRGVVPSERALTTIDDPDWFWIIDADEIYDEGDIVRLKDYVVRHPATSYSLCATSYFKSWNWRIEDRGHLTVLLRPGTWFGHLRHRHVTPWVRLWQKLAHERLVPRDLAFRFFGARVVPRAVATFHHGNYVGDRARIERKLASSGHRADVEDGWLENVWDRWTPDHRDFHPYEPTAFPRAEHVATSELPAAVAGHDWPEGWIEST